MPATSASFGVHSEAGAELPGEPCSKSPQPPSREAFLFTTRYVTFKSFSHKSPPLSRMPETLHFKLGGLDLISTLHQLSVPLTVPHSEENMALIDLEIKTYARERSYPCGSPRRVTSRFCEFNFSSSQKRGWPEARRESPPPQSVHPLRTFQNGGNSYVEGSVKKR